jgi:hypothetical protein
LICTDISISCVLLQSSSFEITSRQWMFRILRKQWLTNVCNFEVIVFITFHVWGPYNSTDLTLLRKIWSLVLVDILEQSDAGGDLLKLLQITQILKKCVTF